MELKQNISIQLLQADLDKKKQDITAPKDWPKSDKCMP